MPTLKYYQNHKEEIKKINREYYQNHKEEISRKRKLYYQKNREKCIATMIECNKKRKQQRIDAQKDTFLSQKVAKNF